MTIILHDRPCPGLLRRDLDTLRELLTDLEALRDGTWPSARDLARAPQISDWSLASRPATCLTGSCRDHPLLAGPEIVTSDLHVLAPHRGWARTRSRLYRLERPRPGGERHDG